MMMMMMMMMMMIAVSYSTINLRKATEAVKFAWLRTQN